LGFVVQLSDWVLRLHQNSAGCDKQHQDDAKELFNCMPIEYDIF